MGEEKRKEGKRDVEELKEVLNVVSEKVPALLNQLADVLYGKDRAEQYGKSVAAFYKELVNAGMSKEQAYEMTKEYMSAMSLGKMMGGAFGHGMDIDAEDDLGKAIEVKIKRKLDKKAQEIREEKDED